MQIITLRLFSAPEEAMFQNMLTATTNLPSTQNEVIDGSAGDAACIYHTDKDGSFPLPDVRPATPRTGERERERCI